MTVSGDSELEVLRIRVRLTHVPTGHESGHVGNAVTAFRTLLVLVGTGNGIELDTVGRHKAAANLNRPPWFVT